MEKKKCIDPTIPNRQQPKAERKIKYLDRFSRKTIYIEESLLKIIQELASNRKGEQTRIINSALEEYFRTGMKTSHPRPHKSELARKTVYIDKILLHKLLDLTSLGYEQIQTVHNALSAYLDDPANIDRHAASSDWYAKPFWNKITIGDVKERN